MGGASSMTGMANSTLTSAKSRQHSSMLQCKGIDRPQVKCAGVRSGQVGSGRVRSGQAGSVRSCHWVLTCRVGLRQAVGVDARLGDDLRLGGGRRAHTEARHGGRRHVGQHAVTGRSRACRHRWRNGRSAATGGDRVTENKAV